MTAFREAGRVVVVVPAKMTMRQQRDLVPALVDRFLANEAVRSAPRGDGELTDRVRELYVKHLLPVVGGEVPRFGARWVTNQDSRWGSCTPATGEIRVSHRLQPMPSWVVDYVLVHEATHLVERNHTKRFKALVATYPDADRAAAFLEGVDFAGRRSREDYSAEP